MKRFLIVMALLSFAFMAAGCPSDKYGAGRGAGATVAAGQSLRLSLAGLDIELSAGAVGNGADQIPPGSRVSLQTVGDIGASEDIQAASPGAVAVGPSYRIRVTDPTGADISARVLSSPWSLTLFVSPGTLAGAGVTAQELVLAKVSGGSVTLLAWDAQADTDTTFTTTFDGKPIAALSSLSDFVLLRNAEAGGGGGGPVALEGTLNDGGAVIVLSLSDEDSGDTLLASFPASAIQTLPATMTADIASFNASNPSDPANRSVILTSGATQYASFNGAASVTITIASRSGATAAGTIVGTLIASGGASKTVNFTLTTAPEPGESSKLVTLSGAQFTIEASATDAVAPAAVFNGTNYVALWLGDDTGAGREIHARPISTTGTLLESERIITTAVVEMNSAAGFRAAYGDNEGDGRILVVGTEEDDASGAVVALVLDATGDELDSPVEITVSAAGGSPLVAYNTAENTFAVAYTSNGGGVAVRLYDPSGTPIAAATVVSADTTQALAGLCSAAGDGEFLVTFGDGSGVGARRIDAATGAALGTEMVFSSSGSGGACGFEVVGGAYLVQVAESDAIQVVLLAVGSDSPGSSAQLSLNANAAHITGGPAGALVATQTNLYQGVESDGTDPSRMNGVFYPPINGISTDFHSVAAAPGVAADGVKGFLVVGASATGGVRAFRLEIN